jgi:hypothetical protein
VTPALLFFKLIEVERKFPFANSISEFSRSQDPERTLDRVTRSLNPILVKSQKRPGSRVATGQSGRKFPTWAPDDDATSNGRPMLTLRAEASSASPNFNTTKTTPSRCRRHRR